MERESHELDASVPLPSTKRLKVLPLPPSKGKEKSEVDPQTCSNPTPEEEEERCGICLTGSTQSIRGQIDSCNHHFCFVCVMEWAKIESRCPLCKQRFGSIRRPAVPGLFPSERVVKISERNQVSNLSYSGRISNACSIHDYFFQLAEVSVLFVLSKIFYVL